MSNDVQEWREYVCLTARNSEEARNHFTGNDDDWEKTWDKLSQKGKYEYEAGDLIIPALAHCTNAPIMIVNADSKVAPFYFVSETVWGGEVSNNPPIILVHDGAHYENLLPETEEDEEITRDVFQFWKTNDFNISRRDISNAKIEARKMSGKETEKRTWAEVAKSNIAAKITEQIFEDQAGTKKRDYEQRKEEKEAARRREKQREEESYKIEGERDELKKREEKKRSGEKKRRGERKKPLVAVESKQRVDLKKQKEEGRRGEMTKGKDVGDSQSAPFRREEYHSGEKVKKFKQIIITIQNLSLWRFFH